MRPATLLCNRLELRIVVLLTVAFIARETQAFAVEPHEIVNDVIQRVMAKVSDMDADDHGESVEVLKVFEQEISPHLDFITITRWLAGERWSNLENDEKAELQRVVRGHIVQVYSALLARGRSVVIKVESTSTIKTRSARVGATLATAEGGELDVEFRLIRSADSWKLYDLAIEGLSFARSLRAELAPVISAGGIAGLRDYLNSHN
jgi:phospholipid transport system substrate-binding protein